MKIVKDILLAMLNATLILIAVCLFLAWQITNTAERVAGSFADNLDVLSPVTESVSGLQQEMAMLREDLTQIRSGSGGLSTDAAAKVQARMTNIENRLDGVQTTLTKIADTPDRLMTTAIDASSAKLSETLLNLRGCGKPSS